MHSGLECISFFLMFVVKLILLVKMWPTRIILKTFLFVQHRRICDNIEVNTESYWANLTHSHSELL